MAVTSSLAGLLAICLLSAATAAAEAVSDEKHSEINVSPTGQDADACGPKDHPCATIRYAVARRSRNGSRIVVDGSRGPYQNETDTEYVNVTHGLTITAAPGTSRVTIVCSDARRTKLFNFGNSSVHSTNVVLQNISINNCRHADGHAAGVMRITNANIKLTSCEFSNNRLLLHHSQLAADNCSSIWVTIINSQFQNDVLDEDDGHAVFEPAVHLAGCSSIHLDVTNATFQTAPVLIRADADTVVNVVDTLFDGRSVRGSSLDLELSPGSNAVSLVRCNVTGHRGSQSSPVVVGVDAAPDNRTKVSLSGVRFVGNVDQKVPGGALAVYRRFRHRPPSPATVGVHLTNCSFVNNSASDVGGAVYLSHVAQVWLTRCRFEANRGHEGGAMFMDGVRGVVVADSDFIGNRAADVGGPHFAARGGAVFARRPTDLSVQSSRFVGNEAAFAGGAVFVAESFGVQMTSSTFEEEESTGKNATVVGPENCLVYVDASAESRTSSPVIALTKNVFRSSIVADHCLLHLDGQLVFRNNSVVCPHAMRSRQAFEKAPYGAAYELERSAMWCEQTCRPGWYLGVGVGDVRRTEEDDEDFGSAGVRTYVDDGSPSPSRKNHTSKCHPCPPHATCQQGQLNAAPNYYGTRLHDGQVELTVCPAGYCCSSSMCSGYQSCDVDGHRSGVLCTGCASDRRRTVVSGTFSACHPVADCHGRGHWSAVVVCFTALNVVAVLLLYRATTAIGRRWTGNDDDEQLATTNCGDADGSDRDSVDDGLPERDVADTDDDDEPLFDDNRVDAAAPVSGVLLSVVFFYQLVPVVYPRSMTSFDVPLVDLAVRAVLAVFSCVPLPFVVVGGFCLDWPSASVAAARYVVLMSFWWFQLGLILLVLVVAGVAASRCCPIGRTAALVRRLLRVYVVPGFLFVTLFAYVPTLVTSFDAVNCVRLGGSSTPVLYGDPSTVCHRPWQIVVLVYACVCIIPLCLVSESGAWLLVRRRISSAGFLFAFCLFPAVGLIRIVVETFRGCCSRRNAGDSGRPSLSTQLLGRRQFPSQSSSVVHMVADSILLGSFGSPAVGRRRRHRGGAARLGTLTTILVRNLAVVAAGRLLADRPSVSSLVVGVSCALSAARLAGCRRRRHSSTSDAAETLLTMLLTTLAVMNLFVSMTYEHGDVTVSDRLLAGAFDWFCRLVVALVLAVVGVLLLISACPPVVAALKRRRRHVS